MTNTNDYINSILDVNASWREQWNEFGCLAAFEYDFLLGGDVFSDALVEKFNITEEQAIDAIYQHVADNNYAWDLKTIVDNFDYVWVKLEDNGGESEETLRDFDDSLIPLIEAKLATTSL